MSLTAMRFTSVLSRQANAPENIRAIGNYLQMLWVDAATIATKMVKRHAFWNWANELFIYEPMGANRLVSVNEDSAIALIRTTCPRPAFARLIHHFPESFFDLSVHGFSCGSG